MRQTGKYQILGDLRYFIPDPLPPANPSLELTPEIMTLFGEASFVLGQLNEMCQKLPDVQRFIKAYIIKEALLSSEIEGIHTTLIEVFTQSIEDGKKISKDTQLVVNYTKSIDAALSMMENENLPLVSRVILRAHEVLMSGGDGDKANPGNYRKQAVRVGELIPPLAPEIPNLMSQLEKYINESSELPVLIKAGLMHVQFETIHPFLDGNGRIGRMLILLMLIKNGLLNMPIFYPSFYFKKYHAEYYQKLSSVRTHGDFEGWIAYYLKGIRDSAQDAYIRAKEIESLEIKLNAIVHNNNEFTKMRETASLVLDYLFGQPITSIAEISHAIGKAYNTVSNILKQFIKLKIVSQNTLHKRNKHYRFDPYLALLEKEYKQ